MTPAARVFSVADQARFALLSGDANPMHIDPVLSRRTQAGAPVVHGVNLMLWALDVFAAADSALPPARSLRAQFEKFLYVGEAAEVSLAQRGSNQVRLDISAAGAPIAKVTVDFGAPEPGTSDLLVADLEPVPLPPTPMDLDFESMAGRSGRLKFAAAPEAIAPIFPFAANWLGARRVAALAASTQLVGMVCPGLHSILNELAVETTDEPGDSMAFRVVRTDGRFRMVRLAIAGGGLQGEVTSIARMPPTSQPSLRSLLGCVEPKAFVGAAALIVGGSRGLGELTAKMIVAGGGRVAITYRLGRAEAEAVAGEIREAGGDCQLLPFDALAPAEAQLSSLSETPTQAYYFATPPIFRPQRRVFDPARFDEFLAAYVDGFWRLSQALAQRRPNLSLFYPSSAAVAERPRGMTEYAMAKAAGEALCADMNAALAPLHVTMRRLPRLLTDQTATTRPTETESAVDTLAPIIREVQSWPRRT